MSEYGNVEPPHHEQVQMSPGHPQPCRGHGVPAHPLPGGERMKKKPPRWVTPFLRALERTGEVRAAAEDAGVDHTTAYARRRAHPDFAVEWVEALAAHAAAKERREKEEGEALLSCVPNPSTIRSSADGSPPPDKLGEDLMVCGNRLKRASPERWGPRKQEAFLAGA